MRNFSYIYETFKQLIKIIWQKQVTISPRELVVVKRRDLEYTVNVSVVSVRALRIIRRDIEAKVRSDKLICLL